jgi:hypothetical protein
MWLGSAAAQKPPLCCAFTRDSKNPIKFLRFPTLSHDMCRDSLIEKSSLER